jgi:hypothetical protein
MKLQVLSKFLCPLFVLLLFIPSTTKAYSILTHEALIDASWVKSIQPLLIEKFPGATEADLKLAHSYAYGGSLMSDIGYSPFGSTYFTNLIHYVRSGDFVENLISEAQNLNEYAFALGSLCHYMGDSYGHSIGTNRVVPMVYPKVGKKFGEVVTYEQDHTSHTRTELAFDVLQLARGNYASQGFHDLIGFNVAIPVLERAFYKTYGQNINDIFGNIDRSVNNFRWAVNGLMPTITRSAWVLKKDEIKEMQPGITAKKFHYKMKRKKYYAEYGHEIDKPDFGERMLAFFISILPRLGPLKTFRFKEIGHDGEKQFIKSFDTVMSHYAAALNNLHTGKVNLANVNFDTGKETNADDYLLADDTYSQLLLNLQDNKFSYLTGSLKENVISFYATADTITFAKRDASEWKKTRLAIQEIKIATPITIDSLKSAEAIQEHKRLLKNGSTK